MIESRLWASNPWWADKARIEKDPQIAKWKESSMRYDPPLRRRIRYEYEPGNSVIYTLGGPRQAGKTTLLKLQIREFLEGGTPPWNLFYYSFDATDDRAGLAEIILEYVRISRGRRDGRAYMFLDEITSVPDWQKGIKWLVDLGRLPDCTVVAAGSRAGSILHAAERLPGRRGTTRGAYDWLLAPMRFSEFVCARDPAVAGFFREHGLAPAAERHGVLRDLLSGKTPEVMDALHGVCGADLRRHLEAYMVTGGTPRIVDERERTGTIGPASYAACRDGIAGDWGQGDGGALERLAGAVADGIGSPASWDGLRRRADLGWKRIRSGALSLQDLSVVSIVYKYGERKKTPRLSGPKKIHFRDPFYMHALRARPGRGDPFGQSESLAGDPAWAGRMAEGIVADHLIRFAADAAVHPQGFWHADHVFFWSDGRGREVDFVLHEGELEAPIEVKYRNRVDHRELGGIASFEGARGTVLSKGQFEQRRDYSVVPAAEFLALI